MTRVAILLLCWLPLCAQTVYNLKGPDGVTRAYTLKPHPRVFLDGPDGTIATALQDPDGSGRGKSSRARGNAWAGLQAAVDGSYLRSKYTNLPWTVALGWFMDNRATISGSGQNYLDYLKSALAEMTAHYYAGTCDKNIAGCGIQVDYPAEWGVSWAVAYSIVHDQLSTAEQQRYSHMLFDGVEEPTCEDRLERIAGTVSVTKGSAIITTANVDFSGVAAGDWIYVKDPATPGVAGSWKQVAGKIDAATITADSNYSSTGTRWIYHVKPWAPGQCGFLYSSVASYNQSPTYVARSASTKLASAMSQVTPGTEPQAETISLGTWTGDALPSTFPYYLYIGSPYEAQAEVVKVTGASGSTYTVVRGDFGQTAAHNAGATVYYQSHGRIVKKTDGGDNRMLAHHVADLLIALAVADDNPNAKTFLENAVAWHSDYVHPVFNAFTSGSAHSTDDYSLVRTLPNLVWADWALLESTVPYGHSTPLDFRSDFYKRVFGDYFLYWPNPWNQGTHLNYGIQEGNCSSNTQPQCAMLPIWLQGLYPGSDSAKYAWQWIENNISWFTTGSLGSDTGFRALFPLLAFDTGSLPTLDYTTALPSSIIWNTTDDDTTNPNSKWLLWVSKTDWTSDATQFTGIFPDSYSDKFSDAFASYAIGKRGWMVGFSTTGSLGPGGSMWHQNGVDLGDTFKGTSNPGIPDTSVRPLQAAIRFPLEKSRVTTDYLYTRVNTAAMYAGSHGVTRALRHFVHLKSAGKKEYIIAYDDVAANPQRMRSFIHYPNNGGSGEGTTSMNSAGTAVSTTNAASATARLNTSLLMPTGSAVKVFHDLSVSVNGAVATVGADCTAVAPCRGNVNGTVYSYGQSSTVTISGTAGTVFIWLDPSNGSLNAGHTPNPANVTSSSLVGDAGVISDFPAGVIRLGRLTWNGSAITSGCPPTVQSSTYAGASTGSCVGNQTRVLWMDAGTTAAAEFVAVHRPTLDVNESPDEVSVLADPDNSYLRLRAGSDSPAIAVLPRAGGSSNAVQFTSTHSGMAQVFVAGLNPGQYTVRLNGDAVIASLPVNEDGTAYFQAAAGTVTIQFAGNLPLGLKGAGLPSGTAGQSYSAAVEASGGTGPYAWSISDGALPGGLSLDGASGTIAGTPFERGTYTFTVQVADSSNPVQTATQQYSLIIEPASTLQILTTDLPDGTVEAMYSQLIEASGGLPPYAWDMAGGALIPAVTLDTSSGLLSGIPSMAGTYTFTVEVRDSAPAPAVARKDFTVTVTPAPALTVGSEDLPGGVVGAAYSIGLSASGGAPPYAWALVSGNLPTGLTLSGDGTISGAPSREETAGFTVLVTDGSTPAQTAQKALSISIASANDSALKVQVLGTTSRKGLVRYGKRGLAANQGCGLAVSADSEFQNIVEAVTDNGGPGMRERVVGETAALTPGTTYYVRANCGAGVRVAQLETSPAGTAVPRLVRTSFSAPAELGADHVTIEYGNSPELGTMLSAACTAGCSIDLPTQSDSILYVRRKYLDARDRVLAMSGISPVLVR